MSGKRKFQLVFDSLPVLSYKDRWSTEYMILTSTVMTEYSTVLAQQSTILNSDGQYVHMQTANVVNGQCIIYPYYTGPLNTGIPAGAQVEINFVIL